MPTYQIEVCGPKNENLIFAPISQSLRGRWSFVKAPRNKSDGLQTMQLACPEIPGIVIELNTDKGGGSILDPLKVTPEGRLILDRAKEVMERFKKDFENSNIAAWPTVNYQLDADGIKTWLFSMRVAIDCNLAVKTSTSADIPTIDEIRAMPGKRVRDPLNSGVQANDLSKFCDDVPVTGGRRTKEIEGAKS